MTSTDCPLVSPIAMDMTLSNVLGPTFLCYCGSSALATGNLVLGELRGTVNQWISSIDLRYQASRDLSKLVGFGNYGRVHEGTTDAEHKRVASVTVIRVLFLPSRTVVYLLLSLLS